MHWWEAASTKEKLGEWGLGLAPFGDCRGHKSGMGEDGGTGKDCLKRLCPLEQLIFQDMECGPRSLGLPLGTSERQRITSHSEEFWQILNCITASARSFYNTWYKSACPYFSWEVCDCFLRSQCLIWGSEVWSIGAATSWGAVVATHRVLWRISVLS